MDIFDKANNWTAADDVRKAGVYPYFRPNTSKMGTEVTIGGKKMIMVGSNNYLGLVTHPEVLEAMVNAINKYGSACTGSPFLNGTLDIRVELEEKLADFVHMEEALVYSTGFLANLGALSTIATRGDYIISDRDNHASIVDGQKLSYAKTVKYTHNDMEDLERVLSNHSEAPVLIVTDGVFSMGGDVCNLPKIVELKKKYKARLMVDEAHSIGVLGPHGTAPAPISASKRMWTWSWAPSPSPWSPSAVSSPPPTRSSTICATTAAPSSSRPACPRPTPPPS